VTCVYLDGCTVTQNSLVKTVTLGDIDEALQAPRTKLIQLCGLFREVGQFGFCAGSDWREQIHGD
jgi:hypothetical protein